MVAAASIGAAVAGSVATLGIVRRHWVTRLRADGALSEVASAERGTVLNPFRLSSLTGTNTMAQSLAQKVNDMGEIVAEGMGPYAASVSIKACAKAQRYYQEQQPLSLDSREDKILVMRAQRRQEVAAGTAREQGRSEMTILQVRFFLLEANKLPEDVEEDKGPLVASGGTNIGKLAGAIANCIARNGQASIVVMGAQAITVVVKATMVAETYVNNDRGTTDGELCLFPTATMSEVDEDMVRYRIRVFLS